VLDEGPDLDAVAIADREEDAGRSAAKAARAVGSMRPTLVSPSVRSRQRLTPSAVRWALSASVPAVQPP
jgi:hypothetical protein